MSLVIPGGEECRTFLTRFDTSQLSSLGSKKKHHRDSPVLKNIQNKIPPFWATDASLQNTRGYLKLTRPNNLSRHRLLTRIIFASCKSCQDV